MKNAKIFNRLSMICDIYSNIGTLWTKRFTISPTFEIKCNSVSLQMTSILTPQEICELDTFTLQQKIEELENHPSSSYFTDILKMAKLELIDRLETEEFGRKLANDQYKIADQILLIPVKPQPQSQSQPRKLPPFSNNRKQGGVKIHTNLLSAGSFVTIGKPPVSHHFKPKIKKVEVIEPTKNFLKAKRQNYSKGKITKVVYSKEIFPRKDEVLSIRQVEPKMATQIDHSKLIIEVKQANPPQQFSLKQKLKREVKQMNVVFRQNDAYDDMRQIKLTPQNLLDQEIKMHQIEPINTQIEQNEVQIKKDQENLSIVTKVQSQQANIQNKQECVLTPIVQRQEPRYQQQLQILNVVPSNIFSNDEQSPEKLKMIQKVQSNLSNLQQITPKLDKISNINLDKLNPQSSNFNKQVKSNSVRTLVKPNYHNLMSDNIRIRGQQGKHQKIGSIRFLKQEFKKPEHKMTKSNYGSFRPIPIKAQTYPYHQVITSFHRLFPHSKNLLLTLRNVEQNLKLHISKQIDEKSRNNQYLRLNENELTFKVISECQKARKYIDYFEIQLETFHKRGATMLNRIRGDQGDSNCQLMLYRVVRTKEEVYDIINSSFHRTNQWHELPHGMQLRVSWNLLWTWSKPQIDFSDLFYFQKVNHFIGNKQIARKDLLKKNIENVQKLGGKMKQFFDIIPETFLLPGQNIAFIKKFREYGLKDPLNYWILKPVGLSRGRGIELINRLEDVVFSEPVVLQRYVSNPFLVDGFKFDMRIYVLVTSINPLEAFIYREGFARLSTERYSLDENLMDNKYIHLTNFSINRENISDRKLTLEQQLGGCKISIKMLKKRLQQVGVAWQRVEKQIQQIVLKSLIACMNTIQQNPNCFELFGYDIFMDSNLKCWLLEVNSSPSLQKQFMLDEVIKQQLVDDIMQIVCPVSYNRQKLLQIVERRRKEAEGLKSSINVATNSAWQLDEDLHYILNGQKLRKYGEVNHRNFKTIAPSQRYYSIVKVLQQYKIDPIIKQQK